MTHNDDGNLSLSCAVLRLVLACKSSLEVITSNIQYLPDKKWALPLETVKISFISNYGQDNG